MIERPTHLNKDLYFSAYIDKAQGEDLIKALKNVGNETLKIIDSLSTEQANFRYAEGKWSIKQLLRHIADTERIFTYRALRISRKDQTPLPGFDENHFAELDNTNQLSLAAIKDEYIHVRKATMALYATMADEVIDFEGQASGLPFTPRTLGWTIVGHNAHHLAVVLERYL